MPEITVPAGIELTVSIEIHNYREIVAKNTHSVAGFLTRVPILGDVIQLEVDDKVSQELMKTLPQIMGQRLSEEINKRANDIAAQICVELQKKHVKATVDLSVRPWSLPEPAGEGEQREDQAGDSDAKPS